MRHEYRYGYSIDYEDMEMLFAPTGDGLRLSPLHSVDSRESFYIQAADIAAGIARYLYEIGGIQEVASRFDYVTLNGRRVCQDDASEVMREWKQKGYL